MTSVISIAHSVVFRVTNHAISKPEQKIKSEFPGIWIKLFIMPIYQISMPSIATPIHGFLSELMVICRLEKYIGNKLDWKQKKYIGNNLFRFETKNIDWKH